MKKPKKPTRHQTGLTAEFLAAIFLRLKGYSILAQRYRTPLGEIDLVVRRGDTIAFVEVKHRKSRLDGAEAVHAGNQKRVRDAAALYLQKHPRYNACTTRFDALLMSPKTWPAHLVNAF